MAFDRESYGGKRILSFCLVRANEYTLSETEIVSIITSKKGATEHTYSLDIMAWRPSDYVK